MSVASSSLSEVWYGLSTDRGETTLTARMPHAGNSTPLPTRNREIRIYPWSVATSMLTYADTVGCLLATCRSPRRLPRQDLTTGSLGNSYSLRLSPTSGRFPPPSHGAPGEQARTGSLERNAHTHTKTQAYTH